MNSWIKQDCLSINSVSQQESRLPHYFDSLVLSRAWLHVCQETAKANGWKLLEEVELGGIPGLGPVSEIEEWGAGQ